MHELWVSIVIFVGGYIALYTLEFTWKLLFRAPIALDAERNEQNLQLLHRLDQYKHGPEWVKDLVLESKRSRGEIPEIQTTPATPPPPIAEAPAEVPIAATIRVKIPNGDVLIGNLKQSGSQITGSVHVRIRTPGFNENGNSADPNGWAGSHCFDTSVYYRSIKDVEPFALTLPVEQDIIEVYAIVRVGGEEYVSERYPLVIS